MDIVVAFGSNLFFRDVSPTVIYLRVIKLLCRVYRPEIFRISYVYKSAPWPVSNQPNYINAAFYLRCTKTEMGMKSADILQILHRIESRFGRQRSVANAARTLDLDLIAVGGEICNDSDLILPHPRAHERAFVMVPVADVAPDWVHPILGKTAAQIAADLPRDGLTCLGRPEALAAQAGFRYQHRSPEL